MCNALCPSADIRHRIGWKEDAEVAERRRHAMMREMNAEAEQMHKNKKEAKKLQAKYVGLRLGKQARIKLTPAQKKDLKGDFILILRLVEDTGKSSFHFDYNDFKNETTTKIIMDKAFPDEDILKPGLECMPYLRQDELTNGILNALRILIKAKINKESVDKDSAAVKKAGEIMKKLKDRAELNKENGLKFNYKRYEYPV